MPGVTVIQVITHFDSKLTQASFTESHTHILHTYQFRYSYADHVPIPTPPPYTLPIGTLAWMDKLQWSGLTNFKAAKKVPFYPDTDHTKKQTGGFYQAYHNLAFYWILNAGHMVRGACGVRVRGWSL